MIKALISLSSYGYKIKQNINPTKQLSLSHDQPDFFFLGRNGKWRHITMVSKHACVCLIEQQPAVPTAGAHGRRWL